MKENIQIEDLFLKKKKKWKNKFYGKHNFKDLFLPHLNEHSLVLEFGCGFGNLGSLISKETGAKVYCVDKEKDFIMYSKTKLSNENIYFLNKIPDIKFDMIILILVIHELEDIDKYMKKFYNILKNKGKIVIYDFRKVSPKKFFEWFYKKKEIGEYNNSFEEEYKEHNKLAFSKFFFYMEKVGFKKLVYKKSGDFWMTYIGEKI